MKKSNKRTVIIPLMLAVSIFLAVPRLVKAQSIYKLVTAPGVTIKVLGSSNVHDWTMASSVMESQGDFNLAGHHLQNLNFRLAFTSLKSEHSSMDDRTYKAVNASKYPDISYKLTSAEVVPGDKGSYLIRTKGNLTIAGVTQPVSMDVTAVANADNTITCSGSKKIQLTDYGIKPPTFMLGAMKVYNDLTIQFNLIYKN
jgi:polyisoprenoid-binding protein YceI